jgi:hypothetical protein
MTISAEWSLVSGAVTLPDLLQDSTQGQAGTLYGVAVVDNVGLQHDFL